MAISFEGKEVRPKFASVGAPFKLHFSCSRGTMLVGPIECLPAK